MQYYGVTLLSSKDRSIHIHILSKQDSRHVTLNPTWNDELMIFTFTVR